MQRLSHAQPGFAVLVLVRFVQAGAPVATSSLRSSRDRGAPCAPSYTYMRVFPLGSVVTPIVGRVVTLPALSDGLICVQVAPPSGERQTPRAYDPA